MIEIKNLSAGYASKEVLKDISLKFEDGVFTSIIGPNGCGKSTLFKAVTGLLPYAKGSIFIDGEDLKKLSGRQRARKAAYIAQIRNVPNITVGKMVLHGRVPYISYPRSYSAGDMAIAEAAMKKTGIYEYRDENAENLSGGQRQKAYLAMALAQTAQNILMDEPLTYLDVHHQIDFMRLVIDLKNAGNAPVMVVHDIILALKYSDKIIVMDEGRVKSGGSPEEVFESGILNRVFGIKINRMDVDGQWQYYLSAD